MVSMNAEVNHCAALALISRSTMRWGMATLMMVSLRITTKAETSNRPMTSLLRAVLSGSPKGAWGADAPFTSVGDIGYLLVWRARRSSVHAKLGRVPSAR